MVEDFRMRYRPSEGYEKPTKIKQTRTARSIAREKRINNSLQRRQINRDRRIEGLIWSERDEEERHTHHDSHGAHTPKHPG